MLVIFRCPAFILEAYGCLLDLAVIVLEIKLFPFLG